MSPIMANLIIKLAISRPKFEYKWDTAIKNYSTWGRSISGQTVPPWLKHTMPARSSMEEGQEEGDTRQKRVERTPNFSTRANEGSH